MSLSPIFVETFFCEFSIEHTEFYENVFLDFFAPRQRHVSCSTLASEKHCFHIQVIAPWSSCSKTSKEGSAQISL